MTDQIMGPWAVMPATLDDYQRGYIDGKEDGEIPLVAVMREVRDASSFDLNPHEKDGGCILGVCKCRRAERIIRSWRAFHDALTARGVRRLAEGS